MAELKKEEPKKPRRRVKKVRGHGGHHGGAWKVAYADFVTAMMALFLVLWLVSQADTKVKQAIANYFRSPGVFTSMKGGILSQAKKVSKEPSNLTSKDNEQTLFSVAENMKQQFGNRPEFSRYKEQIQIDITDEGLRIQLIDKADRVSFPSGSAEIAVDAKAILTEIATSICALPNKINIGGHTDSRVFASENGYTNWELSTDRANAARRILETICVKPEQIHRIVGFADTEPMVPEDPFAPANRRISITVLRLETPQNKDKSPEDDSSSGKNTGEKPAAAADEKPETPIKEAIKQSKPAAETSSDNRTVKAKLLKEGSVVVGEPDKIPSKPLTKESAAPSN